MGKQTLSQSRREKRARVVDAARHEGNYAFYGDQANTQWQVDVAVSCAKLGSLDSILSAAIRKEHLTRGREILISLKNAGKLHPSQDHIGWFDQALKGMGNLG